MRRSNPSKALRLGLLTAGAAAVLLALPATAQRAGTDDCGKTGNCAGGIKPGGVEHAPETDQMRALKTAPAPPPPAASAPAPMPTAPVGAARPAVPPNATKAPKKSDK